MFLSVGARNAPILIASSFRSSQTLRAGVRRPYDASPLRPLRTWVRQIRIGNCTNGGGRFQAAGRQKRPGQI